MTPRLDVVAVGSPRDLGIAQGVVLAKQMHAARAMLANLEAFRLLQPRWLPYPLFLRSAERRARRGLEEPIRRHQGEAARRIEGLAEASGMKLESLYLLNGLEAFMCSLSGCLQSHARQAAAAAASACSAIVVRGRRSASGVPIIARNFDYLPIVQPFYALRECRPAEGFRSLEFIVAPLAGAIDGINERGLAITYNYAYAIDHGPAAPTISMAITSALARCATVAEAAAHIAAIPRSGAGLLMLADATGDIASLELSNVHHALRRPGEPGGEPHDDALGRDALFHTNSYATAAMQRIEAPANAFYSQRVPKPLRGRRVLESSDRRDDRVRQLLAEEKPLCGKALGKIMADHGEDDTASEATLCMHSDYWNTTACIQLYPAERRMRVAYDTACRARYVDFGL